MSLPGKIALIAIGSWMILFSLACSSREIVSDRARTYYASPEEALAKIRKADSLKGALKTIARMEIRSGEEIYPIKAAVIAKSPGSLRIETIPLIGPPDFFMVMDEDKLKVFYPGRELFYVGKATKEHLMSFLPVSISPRTMVSFLTASYPEYGPSGDGVSLHGRPDGMNYRLDLVENGITRQSCWVDTGAHYLVRMDSFDADGKRSYSVDYRDFKRIGQVALPREVIFEACSDSRCQRGHIRYSDTELEPHVDQAVFDIEAPPGIKTIKLE